MLFNQSKLLAWLIGWLYGVYRRFQQYSSYIVAASVPIDAFLELFLPVLRTKFRLIVWYLMPFSTLFQLYRGGQCIYPCFPRIFLPVFCTIFIPSDGLLSHIVEIMDSGESNQSHRNDYHQSSERIFPKSGNRTSDPPVRKSSMLPTRLWGSKKYFLVIIVKNFIGSFVEKRQFVPDSMTKQFWDDLGKCT